jgi:clan AA aspartic protease (TIGR02281 family)
LESSFNNRKHPIVFDTGASNTVLGKNHLAAMGIAPPAGPADDEMVGAGGSQKAWHMKLDVRVGGIERKNFPVVVQENMLSNPLLGLNFFQGYNYTIDSGAHSLDFSKKRAGVGSVYGASTRDPSVVPFKRERRHIIVTVDVNGRKTDMLFDTGAEGTSFTNKQLKDLGISVPPDAVDAVWAGIGGTTKEKHFPLRSIKLGPIEKRDLEIAAVENSEVPWPILGQNFFGNWQYTFDDQASVIRFVRR